MKMKMKKENMPLKIREDSEWIERARFADK